MRIHLAPLALLLLATPALAADTARVSGNPAYRSGAGLDFPIEGHLPEGATVGLQSCLGDDSWCLVTGAGWVEGSHLVARSPSLEDALPDLLGDPLAVPRSETVEDEEDDGLTW